MNGATETEPKQKTDLVRSALRALEKLSPEERTRVVKAAVALWAIEVT